MADVSHLSNSHRSSTIPAPTKSIDIPILLSAALVAVGLCVVVAIYSDPAKIAPADPVAASFYP
jgi:hypothetical protein